MSRLSLPIRLDRSFQIWSYQVTHNVLLLRSNMGPGVATRIDLMFRMVRALKLGSRYDSLTLSLMPPDRIRSEFSGDPAMIEDRYVFSIDSSSLKDGYVVAGALFFAEDDMDYGEPSSIDHPEFENRIIRAAEIK